MESSLEMQREKTHQHNTPEPKVGPKGRAGRRGAAVSRNRQDVLQESGGSRGRSQGLRASRDRKSDTRWNSAAMLKKPVGNSPRPALSEPAPRLPTWARGCRERALLTGKTGLTAGAAQGQDSCMRKQKCVWAVERISGVSLKNIYLPRRKKPCSFHSSYTDLLFSQLYLFGYCQPCRC